MLAQRSVNPPLTATMVTLLTREVSYGYYVNLAAIQTQPSEC